MPSTAEMQRAVWRRDSSYAGVFVLGVRTTGIFCRPGCPARRPKAENIEYFATAREALFAGYRPCKRCRPMDTNGRPPAWVARLLAVVEEEPGRRIRDHDLRLMSIDPARARRYFKGHYGMTFQAYNRARRLGEAIMQIKKGAKLDEVSLGIGFESSSGFRDAFARTFGNTPGRSRAADCMVATQMESPLGPLIACATTEAVCLLEFNDRRAIETQFDTLGKRFGCPIVPGGNGHLEKLKDELAGYFAGELREFTVPIAHPGTPFQEAVWRRLLEIPYGRTLCYAQLAIDVGRPGAQRAVGTANGKNRLAIVIPCHRVVNKSGKLGGYGGGVWRKQFLLDLEQGGRLAIDD